jgi:hypothetical protein
MSNSWQILLGFMEAIGFTVIAMTVLLALMFAVRAFPIVGGSLLVAFLLACVVVFIGRVL